MSIMNILISGQPKEALAIRGNLYDKELWIGLAEVEPTSRNGVLGDVRGAFTNAVAMAKW